VEIPFIPSEDVIVILNALLDKFENRARRNHADWRSRVETEAEGSYSVSRSIKITLDDLDLPSYFSQIDPQARIVANQQLQSLEQQGLLRLKWLPGETNHLIQSISLPTEQDSRKTNHATLYSVLHRTPISDHRARLEFLLLAEKFRYQKEDWRAHALEHTLQQLRAGKSPAPFSLTDSNLNIDLLTVLQALPALGTETPYRVFSVRVLNDSKRFEDLKPALVRLARRANPEWKSFASEDLLRELNLVANPGYVHLAGNWQLTDLNGQLIDLDCFTPSIGFPATQITSLQKISIRAESVLCIENLTSFHEFLRSHAIRSTPHATLCLMGNPSPSIRHLLRLIPVEIPIYVWADMDYGGFNILAQLRKQVGSPIRPYLMDIATVEKYAPLSRPLTRVDTHNLKRLARNPTLNDVHRTIEHILQRGLKLEQEAIQV
jgi:Uncharacterized protein conserved in bacteria C-term(DUF2220)